MEKSESDAHPGIDVAFYRHISPDGLTLVIVLEPAKGTECIVEAERQGAHTGLASSSRLLIIDQLLLDTRRPTPIPYRCRLPLAGCWLLHSLTACFLAARCSLLTASYRHSLLATRYSQLATSYSLLATRYSLLATRY